MIWTPGRIILVSAVSGTLVLGIGGGAAYALGASHGTPAAAAGPAQAAKAADKAPDKAPAARPRPVPTKTIYVQPPAQSAPAQAPAPAPAPDPQFTNAVAVVTQFYQDITDHDYAAAWSLGGSNVSGGVGYDAWVAGYSTTVSIGLVGQADWDSGAVHTDISALQASGAVNTYSGTYYVSNGVIVGASIVQTG